MAHGATSSKCVDGFHQFVVDELKTIFTEPTYTVVTEMDLPSTNSTGKKRCDVCVLRGGVPYMVFPVKLTKSNYKQNKNNAWENLTGEVCHLKWANPHLLIIPINIFMDKTPYLSQKKVIRFETITYEDISNYSMLKDRLLVYDTITYIIQVEHHAPLNEVYTHIPTLLGFHPQTPFRTLSSILVEGDVV